MGYIMGKKPATHNYCSAVCCQIDGTFQYLTCIDHLLDSYRTKVTRTSSVTTSGVTCTLIHAIRRVDFANRAHSE